MGESCVISTNKIMRTSYDVWNYCNHAKLGSVRFKIKCVIYKYYGCKIVGLGMVRTNVGI